MASPYKEVISMRIELPREVERFGAVRFGCLQKVFAFDSGRPSDTQDPIRSIPYETLTTFFQNMAIIVPVKGEKLKLLEGVLCGIPHACLVIIVSNSPRQLIDRFRMEQRALSDYCQFAKRQALIIHQKDPRLAAAFKKVGYKSILNAHNTVCDGKAEGMIIGTLLANLAGKRYVGFIDSDNYFPGSAEEYVREYAAGFSIARSRYCMSRICWHSKPKVAKTKLFFYKWGRTSEHTNRLLNQLISHYNGYDTEIIKTGNAGEHALSMDLAMAMDYSAGYSIEPYHIINLIEKFGGIQERSIPSAVLEHNVEVFQIESRNPHLHEAGDTEHVRTMLLEAISVIYGSFVTPIELKRSILKELREKKLISAKQKPPQLRYFPALESIDLPAFLNHLGSAPYAEAIRKGEV